MDQLLGHLFNDRRKHPTRREVIGRLVLAACAMATGGLTSAEGTNTHLMILAGGMLAGVLCGRARGDRPGSLRRHVRE
jgi:hypothetical protein